MRERVGDEGDIIVALEAGLNLKMGMETFAVSKKNVVMKLLFLGRATTALRPKRFIFRGPLADMVP